MVVCDTLPPNRVLQAEVVQFAQFASGSAPMAPPVTPGCVEDQSTPRAGARTPAQVWAKDSAGKQSKTEIKRNKNDRLRVIVLRLTPSQLPVWRYMPSPKSQLRPFREPTGAQKRYPTATPGGIKAGAS